MRKRVITLLQLAVTLLATLPLTALAQNAVRHGELTVHYNALPTTDLDADVARQYGITRSSGRALLNVTVRKGEPGSDRGVPAQITAAATNLNGQRQQLNMREVREGDAIYYIGEARVADKDTLSFEIEVSTQGSDAPIRASFQQTFFARN